MTRPAFALALVALTGCAAFPELDGQPVTAIPAAALQLATPTEPRLSFADFGDAGLRRMLAEADLNGLDLAAARGRAIAADMALAQTGQGRAPQVGISGSGARRSVSAGLSVSFDPDLAGRMDAALAAARYEAQAAGVDLVIARRMLAREVATGWVALGEAQTAGARSQARADLATRQVAMLRAQVAAGEITGSALTDALSRQTAARQDAAQAGAQAALATARLRALGVRQVPAQVSLRQAELPRVPDQSNLARMDHRPEVCAAWLRLHAADASRAEALRAARPRLVASGSVNAAAQTLAGLISGNPLALAASLSVDGAVFDGGQSRNRVDQARLGVAQAELGWLQARSRAEIALLEAAVDLNAAREGLAAAREGYNAADAERTRIRARQAAGVEDGLAVVSADIAVLDAQIAVDQARARAFRAAAIWNDASGTAPTPCHPALTI